MKNIKHLFIFTLIIILMPLITSAENLKIDNYDLFVNVSKDRKYEVKENIKVSYTEDATVIKTLPNGIKDLDVDGNEIVETSQNKIIKLPMSVNRNRETFRYTYNYQLKDYNEKIYQINIKNNFNTELKNAKFYITIDDNLSKDNIEIFLNNKKSKDVKYNLNKKTINGEIKNLKENDVITIKVKYSKFFLTPMTATAIIIPIILTSISTLLWSLYGKDLKYKITPTKDIPKGLNALDVGLIDKGFNNEKDIFAFILELANKGYISITEGRNTTFTIKKIKDYDGKIYKEKMFMKALFHKTNLVSITDYLHQSKKNRIDELDDEITSDNIQSRFERTKNIVLTISNEEEEKEKYYEKTSDRKRSYLILIIAIILILLTSIPFIELNKLYLIPISVIFSIISLYVLLNFVEKSKMEINRNILGIFAFLAIVILFLMLTPTFRNNRVYILTFFISLICILINLFLYKYMPRRTIYGSRKYSKIEGFIAFITEGKFSDIEEIIKENPNYLFDILPYAYSLNIENEVFDMIKETKPAKPEWWELKSEYTPTKLCNSIERFYTTINSKKEN